MIRESHVLAGFLDRRAPAQIRQSFSIRPPSLEQLDELAIEELLGLCRPDVFLVFEEWFPAR